MTWQGVAKDNGQAFVLKGPDSYVKGTARKDGKEMPYDIAFCLYAGEPLPITLVDVVGQVHAANMMPSWKTVWFRFIQLRAGDIHGVLRPSALSERWYIFRVM